jgi:hypothetical protein
MTWVRAELLLRLQEPAPPAAGQLAQLAVQAVAFVDGLRASGRLAVEAGDAGVDIEADLATAWLLTEAARQGLAVTSDQIAEAIKLVLDR